MPSDPPSNSMLHMLVVLCATLINLLKQPLHIFIIWPDHLKIASYTPVNQCVYIYTIESTALDLCMPDCN